MFNSLGADRLMQQFRHPDDFSFNRKFRHFGQTDMAGYENHAERTGGLHHHKVAAFAELRNPFSMSGKRNTGQIDRIFVHRRSNNRIDLTGQRILRRGSQRIVGQPSAPRVSRPKFKTAERKRSGRTDPRQNPVAPTVCRFTENRLFTVNHEFGPAAPFRIGGDTDGQFRADSRPDHPSLSQ